ncbi:MAG: hypothetical protein ACRDPY_18015 [Streptosporangiaceae bacterium]
MAGGFFRHRGLIAFCVGGAIAETGLLSFLAPAARPLAPQVTALPPLAAYHDLRWLFAFNQSWLGFTGVLVLLLLARAAADVVLLLLAWPQEPSATVSRPRFLTSFVSCAVLTVLVWLVMSPVVTLMFGVALVPFSWPFLAAVPIMLGTTLVLSHGGVGQAWWRRLPPGSTVAWLLVMFLVLSAASVAMAHLDTAGALAVAGLAGVVNARAWYGLTAAAVRRAAEQPPRAWQWPRGVRGGGQPPRAGGLRGVVPRGRALLPVTPVAAVMVIALVVGLTRLAFTGTVQFSTAAGDVAASAVTQPSGGPTTGIPGAAHRAGPVRGAVLVVEGFGSTCCDAADALAAAEPDMIVRQFSYLGLNAAGNPIPYGPDAEDLPIQVLGDRMATQLLRLYQQAHVAVDVVAESEGTLGLYAMLARHLHLPVRSLVLLSPIVDPGQMGEGGQASGTVPGDALITLNNLVGGMSPYGSSGAKELIDSVSQVGATYFASVSKDRGIPWLAVIPLADAVTLPACPWPRNVIFVAAFHGGLLGHASVRQMVASFLGGGRVSPTGSSQQRLRSAAQLISSAATAWRMPDFGAACPA